MDEAGHWVGSSMSSHWTSAAVLQRLEEHCKGVNEAQAGTVEIETSVLGSAVECLREAADTQKQLELAQEQLTMKPSVAKKLNDRIKALETELSITRKRSNIAELEKKVARLEIELRQSYSTKNFTLKSGLLDIEKRHRDFIYDNPAIEDLWTEVLGLLVEDKEALPAGTVIQKAKINQKYRRSSSSGVASSGLPNGLSSAAAGAPDALPPLDNRSLNKVQDEIEKLEEHVTSVPLLPPPQPSATWRGLPGIGSRSFSNPAFCWYADLGVGRTATTVQQHIDTLNTAVASLRNELKGMGLLEQPPTPLSTPPPASKSQQQQQQQELQLIQQQQVVGSPEAVCSGMEALSVSVQHLLELLPSVSGGSGAGSEDTYEALQATIDMEFTSFNKQAEEVLYCMEQLSMAFGTLQAQTARKQQQAAAGSATASESGFNPASFANGSNELSVADGMQHMPEGAKEFYKQASALTNAVQQLRALLSVHMQRAQQRLRDMATPPMPPPAKAATAASSMLTAQQQQQQQQEDFAGMPPGTVQALASRFLSFLASQGHFPSVNPSQQHSAQYPQQDPQGTIAGTSLEQLLQDFVASQCAAGGVAGETSSRGIGRGGGMAAGLPPLPPSIAKPREEAALCLQMPRTNTRGGLVLEVPSSELPLLSEASSLDPSNLSFSGQTTPHEAASSCAGGALGATAADGDVGQEASAPGAEPGAAPGAEPGAAGEGERMAPEVSGAEAGTAAAGEQCLHQGTTISAGPARMAPDRSIASENTDTRAEVEGQGAGLAAGSRASLAGGVRGPEGTVSSEHAQPEDDMSPATPCQQMSSCMHDAAQQQQQQQQQQQGDQSQKQQQQQQQQGDHLQEQEQQQQQHPAQRKMQDVGLGPMSPRSPMSPRTPRNRESASEILPEDYAAEIDQLRAIAAHHAEITASSQELVASLSAQHTAAMMRADELEARLARFEKEIQMQSNENEVLTRALVEVKVAYAEKDSENMRLAQRLKRSLKNSDVSREEIEYLKSKLMAVTPDQVGVEADDLEDIKAAVQEAAAPPTEARKSAAEEGSVKDSDAPESPVPLD